MWVMCDRLLSVASTTADIQQLHFLLCPAGSAPFLLPPALQTLQRLLQTAKPPRISKKVTDLKKQHFYTSPRGLAGM